MDTVSRILEFINKDNDILDGTVAEEKTPNTEKPAAEPTTETPQPETPQPETPVAEPIQKKVVSKKQHQLTEEQQIRQLNRLYRKQEYPCIANVNGQNKVFNNEAELNEMLVNMKETRKQNRKELKRKQIAEYKHFDEEYVADDEDLVDDDLIYKRGDIVAVKKDNKLYKAPRTNKKDRTQIYNSIKDNKKLLVDLTTAKDDETFNQLTADNLQNEELNIYNKHKDNKINKDSTWTKQSFLAMMNRIIDAEENKRTNDNNNTDSTDEQPEQDNKKPQSLRQQYQIKRTSSRYNLNPLLFTHM